jgi:heterodisulfide reductase subunit A-like polyferredoxin
MVQLGIDFAGLKFKNPVSAAAGPITSTPYTIRRCIEHGIGSVVVKSVGLDEEKCTGCGLCDSCICGAIVLEEKRPRIDLESCERCGACVTICPKGALSVVPAQ